MSVRLFGPGSRQPFAMLCSCPCHAACPLSGQRKVQQAAWTQECTCLGAVSRRAIYQRRRRVLAEVAGDVDVGRGQRPAPIQQALLRAFEEHGEDPRTDFSRISRFVSAATGRRGTRTVRLVSETVHGLAAAKRYSDQQAPPTMEANVANKRSLRRLRHTVLASAALTATAVIAARTTRGPTRGALILAALGLAAVTAWTTMWAAVLTFLSLPPQRHTSDSAR